MKYALGSLLFAGALALSFGAARADVIVRVLGGAIRLALVGIVLGLTVAAFTTRGLETLLFDVSPADWRTFAAVSLGVTVVALAAAALTTAVATAGRT